MRVPLVASLLLALGAGCGPSTDADAGAPDTGGLVDTGSPEVDSGPPALDSGSLGPDSGPSELEESEPNDGDPFEEVDDLPVGALLRGVVAESDADVFLVPTVGGRIYRATVQVPAGSPLDAHLTVLDSGRGDDAPGSDYAKLGADASGPGAVMEFVAMGSGHYVVVRDARAVAGGTGGGADHDYALAVEEISRPVEALRFPSTITGSLSQPSAVAVYSFEADEGTDVVFDVDGATGLDLRLYVVSLTTGSWIARNDDRGAGELDPLIDAPLTASGQHLLVVETPDGEGANLGFSLDARMP